VLPIKQPIKFLAPGKSQEGSKEIDINIKNSDITKKFISDRVDLGGFVEFKDALDSCVYFCKTITGHGSHQSVRNYIAALTSSVSPFEIIKNEQKKEDYCETELRFVEKLHGFVTDDEEKFHGCQGIRVF